MNKKEDAEFLQVSEKTIERFKVNEAAEVSGLPKAFIDQAIKNVSTFKVAKIGDRY